MRIVPSFLPALAGLLLVASSARADRVWNWSYSGAGINASGTFATGDTPNGSGFYSITSIAGSRNGDAITGLWPAGQAIPGNEPFAVDNLVRVSGSQLTVEGFGFSLASGRYANTFFADFLTPPSYFEVLTQGGILSEIPVTFSARLEEPATVPEPRTLALLAVGLVGLRGSRQLRLSRSAPRGG